MGRKAGRRPFLLCSDGLHGPCERFGNDGGGEGLLHEKTPCRKLIQMAKERGGYDQHHGRLWSRSTQATASRKG